MAYKDLEKKRAAQRRQNAKYYANRTPEQKEQTRKRAREWRLKYPERFKANQKNITLKKKYGITLEKRDAAFESQGRRCAICKSTEPGSKAGWHVDHCHETKTFRAILCSNCNISLGHAKDDEQRLLDMISYLRKHRKGIHVILTA